MEKSIPIVKADGTAEPFKLSKLQTSLKRSGVPKGEVEAISNEIALEMGEGVSTNDIYHKVFTKLQKSNNKTAAARYSLRRALFDLGPSGFPFETFVSEIFRAQGYRARTGVMLRGKCSKHEIDVLAEKRMERIGAELKFHNNLGMKTDLKVALYVHARFEDIHAHAVATTGGIDVTRRLLVTNTKFTKNAIDYAKCAGLELIGWSYPRKDNLQDMIEKVGLHPLTCLTSLSTVDKRKLLERKVVLCKTIRDNPHIMRKEGIKENKIAEVLKESELLCVPGAAV